MKKLIFSLAILSVSCFSMLAQTKTAECQSKGKCAKVEKCCEKTETPCAVADGICCQAFEGITLTDDQKAKLAAINKGKCNARKECKTKDCKKEKPTVEEMKKMRAERTAKLKEDRKNYLLQVKEILTPEQYVTFLENSYTMQNNRWNSPMLNRLDKNRKLGMRPMHKMKTPDAGKDAGKEAKD